MMQVLLLFNLVGVLCVAGADPSEELSDSFLRQTIDERDEKNNTQLTHAGA
jgi:hypothetical protein